MEVQKSLVCKVHEVIYLWLVKGPELEKMYLCCWKRLLFDRKNLRLFFSSREFFFSSIWTAKTSLRSVLTTVRSRKRKILSRKRNFAFEFFHLRATSFQPLGTIIPATIAAFLAFVALKIKNDEIRALLTPNKPKITKKSKIFPFLALWPLVGPIRPFLAFYIFPEILYI